MRINKKKSVMVLKLKKKTFYRLLSFLSVIYLFRLVLFPKFLAHRFAQILVYVKTLPKKMSFFLYIFKPVLLCII